jgi:hypothetical protein
VEAVDGGWVSLRTDESVEVADTTTAYSPSVQLVNLLSELCGVKVELLLILGKEVIKGLFVVVFKQHRGERDDLVSAEGTHGIGNSQTDP